MDFPTSNGYTPPRDVLNVRDDSFEGLLPLTGIITARDIVEANEKGYSTIYTLSQFQEKHPDVDPERIFYTKGAPVAYYWDKENLIIVPLYLREDEDYPAYHGESLSKFIERSVQVSQSNPVLQITAVNGHMRSQMLKWVIERGVEDPYELFHRVYMGCEFGVSVFDQPFLEYILSKRSEKSRNELLRKLEPLPDIVTVYRGSGELSADLSSAISWTLNAKTAFHFSIRLAENSAVFHEAKVKREDIFDCFDSESECLILPGKVFDIVEHAMYGLDWLPDMLEKVAPAYHEYKNSARYDKIPFEIGSEIHEKAHSCRVLLLCLLLSDMCGLSRADEKILAEAALYHDTGRYNDGENSRHGILSAKKYKRFMKDPDPIVLFLMKYHCKDDSEGLDRIESDPVLSPQQDRIRHLYEIFKDADGLDRVRLGPNDLDFYQLRTKEAKQLPLVAKITLHALKV